MVQNGGMVRDVIVDHPIYGEITGNLMLGSMAAVDSWLQRVRESNSMMLTTITNGIHMHTVEAAEEETLNKIEHALRDAGLLCSKFGCNESERSGKQLCQTLN